MRADTRVAAFYDIHGNLPALEAVLEGIRREKVDLVVIGGDVVPGPMPRETLACLMGMDVPTEFILGNGEVAVLEETAGREPPNIPERYRPAMQWTAHELYPEYARVLAGWQKALQTQISGVGKVLFCHATPRNENEVFTRLTPEERLSPIFEGLGASVVICGHTHMQFDRTVGRVRVVNAGSVGMRFGKPGAYWLLLGPDVQLRHTTYDLTKAAERIRGSNYPEAQDFAERNILHPPSEQEMLEAFSRVELRV